MNCSSLARIPYLLCLLLISSLSSFSQQRCGTNSYSQILEKKGAVERQDQFEEWIRRMLSQQEKDPTTARASADEYRVQVVVHVIHNGENIGQGSNISDAQIQSQIEVLNADFRRLNVDAAETPAEFLAVAGGMNINFELAQQDPQGNPSNGINRVKGSKQSWTMDDDLDLKALSYWSSNNYLNIWVCNLTDYIGYTQFPISSLPGLANSSSNPLTDGIVIRFRAFGSIDFGNFNLDFGLDKGRTATHEIGHFLGLRHIWGDQSNCDGTDYVSDTPPQSGSSSGCPDHPQLQCPQGSPRSAMFQNFLDLTDDQCMNLFTKGQLERVRIVLENSPRRASLLTASVPVAGRPFEKIFSPNGDGINDYWKWSDYNMYEGCALTIFNRFGKQVYEMNTYDGSWDGKSSDGQILEEEAYFFVISCDANKDVTGGVRIVR